MYRLCASILSLAPCVVHGTPTPLSHRGSTAPPSCSDATLHGFEWTVEGFDFHASYVFTTPAHQSSWGYASFNLSNPALPGGALASCSAQSDQLSDFFYGTVPYQCTTTATTSSSSSSSSAQEGGPAPATFSFSRPSGELDVNQTWTCYDRDPAYPTRFSAFGRTTLALDCTDTTWQNSNWTIGQVYSDREVKCAPVTLGVKPYKMTAVA